MTGATTPASVGVGGGMSNEREGALAAPFMYNVCMHVCMYETRHGGCCFCTRPAGSLIITVLFYRKYECI